MRVIAKRTLRKFWEQQSYRDAEQPIRAWYGEAEDAEWSTPNDIKAQYRNASILKSNRVVFNIAGNKYRLVVKINFEHQIVYIRFVGTHAQYDEIDVETV